jgi:hypothetical protein
VNTWILLEYRGLWADDAVDGSMLGSELKAHLRSVRARLPRARVLFVRRAERREADGLLVFVARTSEMRSELRCLELESHDELIGLDLESAGAPLDHPLFLVCTHGKHDRCCARYGRPLYDSIREQVEEGWAWQSTHVGGDRFAGNLVALPDGVYYGRVEPADVWSVVEAVLERRVHLPSYRGRSCHSPAAQAAERAVREGAGLFGIDDVRIEAIEREGGGWRASVSAHGTIYDVDVQVEYGDATHLTCSTERLSRPRRYVAGTPRARAA